MICEHALPSEVLLPWLASSVPQLGCSRSETRRTAFSNFELSNMMLGTQVMVFSERVAESNTWTCM